MDDQENPEEVPLRGALTHYKGPVQDIAVPDDVPQSVKDLKPLTRRFLLIYVDMGCRNQGAAYVQARGADCKHPAQNAYAMKCKPGFRKAMREYRDYLADERTITVKELIAVLSDIVMGDATSLISDDGKVDLKRLRHPRNRHLLASLSVSSGDGPAGSSSSVSIVTNSKIQAGKLLAQLMGWEAKSADDVERKIVELRMPGFGAGEVIDQDMNEIGKVLDGEGDAE